MSRLTSPPPPRWRRALSALWRVVRFTFKLLFIILLVVVPIPIALFTYRPHRERRNHAALVVTKREE